MQVNAISNKIGFAGTLQSKKYAAVSTPSFEGKKENNVSNHSLTNATKALALSTLLTLSAAGITSCDKMEFDETHVYPIEIPTDTIVEKYYYPVPGETRVDTVRIKPGYDSPVAPIIKEFFEDNDIDTGDGKIPVIIRYIDEYRHPKANFVFNEEKSSPAIMTYDVRTNEWDDEEFGYVEGKNENYYRASYSTPDRSHQLIVKLERLKSPGLNKDMESSWTTLSEALYDVKERKRYVINENGEAEYDGYFEKGDVVNSMFYINNYGGQWRYKDIEVESVTPKETIIEDKK